MKMELLCWKVWFTVTGGLKYTERTLKSLPKVGTSNFNVRKIYNAVGRMDGYKPSIEKL